jgi:hypothetical protein
LANGTRRICDKNFAVDPLFAKKERKIRDTKDLLQSGNVVRVRKINTKVVKLILKDVKARIKKVGKWWCARDF